MIAKHAKLATLLSLFLVAALVGTAFVAAHLPQANAGQNDAVYGINEFGRTYGNVFDAPSPEAEPDLIAATATNGSEGYVLKSDLDKASGYSSSGSEGIENSSSEIDKSAAALCRALNNRLPFGLRIDDACATEMMEALRCGDMPAPSVSDAAEIAMESLPSDPRLTQAELEGIVQEALLDAENELTAYIPVYLEDGETKVGDFPVSTF